MTYKNANRRILLLVQAGVIEEIKYTERVPHGRIDYKLTIKGLTCLVPYFLGHPEEVMGLVMYMDKVGIDRSRLALPLMESKARSTEALNEFQRYTGDLYSPPKLTDNESTDSLRERIRVYEEYDNVIKRLQQAVESENRDLLEMIEFIRNSTSGFKAKITEKGKKKK
jgi:hypothetical protein